MFSRLETRQIKVGNITLGHSNEVVIQSMTTTRTSNVKSTVKQILLLESYGCKLVRVAILDKNDAMSLSKIKKQVHIPLVADIHFNYKLALLAIENGADKIRINPGNITSNEEIKQIVLACKAKHIPIRIGINSGSLSKEMMESNLNSVDRMIETLKQAIKLIESFDFYDICISFKSSDANTCIEAYKKAATLFSYPLHLGLTEAGPLVESSIQSSYVLNKLLELGIGDTIRVSISGNPIDEIKVAKQILFLHELIKMPKLISCPTCGRCQTNIIKYIKVIEDYLYKINKPIKVAIMGCVVNGPGEAKDADIGVAFNKLNALLFKKGKPIKEIKHEEVIDTLLLEINNF